MATPGAQPRSRRTPISTPRQKKVHLLSCIRKASTIPGMRAPAAMTTSLERHGGVSGAMHLQDGNGPSRTTRIGDQSPRNRRNGGDSIRQLAREAVGLHAAVGHARHEDSLRIDVATADKPIDEFADECDVVGVGATWSGCREGAVVVLDAVSGAEHDWFGPTVDPGQPNATAVVWDFFRHAPARA
jgi:poly(3-hydroxybutyrate) depolymerase